jgi:hypothetical protein
MTDMPIVETYKGVGIHDFQTRQRIEEIVKPAIDHAYTIDDPEELFSYACSPANAPEARGLARARLEAMVEDRTSHRLAARIDLRMLGAGTSGIASHWADTDSYGSLFEAIHQPGIAAPRPPEFGKRMKEYFSRVERERLIAGGWRPAEDGRLVPPSVVLEAERG